MERGGVAVDNHDAITLAEVAERLDRMGVTWAVFAGAAASVYGAGRPITDVDILVPAADGDRVAAGFPEAVVRHYADGTTGMTLPGLDLVALRGMIQLDGEMATRISRHKITDVEVPVVPPEDNMLLKGLLGCGPEVGKHDWADVRAMIEHLQMVDWAYLDWRVEAMGAPQQARRVLDRLRSMWQERFGERLKARSRKEQIDGRD